ncbi:MAG: hypothetical protein ABIR67_05835 [Gaiellaceae bacterium]
MDKPGRVAEVEALIREIQRYLRYLDALRTTNRPPRGGAGGRSTK